MAAAATQRPIRAVVCFIGWLVAQSIMPPSSDGTKVYGQLDKHDERGRGALLDNVASIMYQRGKPDG